jgi:hypothetical protein
MKDYSILPQEEKDALVKLASDEAAKTETLYGNCVQSVLNGLYVAFPDMGITPEMIKGGFGLAGGCCISLKGTCGALSGAAFAISLFYGRPVDDFGGYYDDCQALIRTVMDAFEEKYGGVLCYEVLTRNLGAPYDWKTEEGFMEYNAHDGTPHDAEVVAFCTEKVARMLVDGKLRYGAFERPDVDNPYYKSPNTLKKIAAWEEAKAKANS